MSNSSGRKENYKTNRMYKTYFIEQGRYQALPQVAESKIPQPMDVAGRHCLYDEFVRQIK
jgi:hypothetical protein